MWFVRAWKYLLFSAYIVGRILEIVQWIKVTLDAGSLVATGKGQGHIASANLRFYCPNFNGWRRKQRKVEMRSGGVTGSSGKRNTFASSDLLSCVNINL